MLIFQNSVECHVHHSYVLMDRHFLLVNRSLLNWILVKLLCIVSISAVDNCLEHFAVRHFVVEKVVTKMLKRTSVNQLLHKFLSRTFE